MRNSISTLGPIGYLPASGTCATIATLPVAYFLSLCPNIYLPIVLVFISIANWSIKKSLSRFKSSDPSEIVIDEFIGTLVTFLFVSLTLNRLLAGFLLFRFFDILKPFGIKRIEKLEGSVGVLMDDVLAGIYANLTLHILIYASVI